MDVLRFPNKKLAAVVSQAKTICGLHGFSSVFQRNAFANDIIPVESYMDAIQAAHLGALSAQPRFTLNASLKHMLHALVRFCGDLVM